MNWELRHVEDTEAILDNSGVYVVIHRIERTETHKGYSGIRVSVRADLMGIVTTESITTQRPDEPIMSFQGSANAVRKALIRFLDQTPPWNYGIKVISLEHTAYIGYELHRAESTPNFVQD